MIHSNIMFSPLIHSSMRYEDPGDMFNRDCYLNLKQPKTKSKEHKYLQPSADNAKEDLTQKELYEQGVLCVYDYLMIMGS